jgi:hypothetical protein
MPINKSTVACALFFTLSAVARALCSILYILSVFLAPIIGTCGQVLDESHPLSNFDLLFFRELTSLAGDIGRRVVHLSIFLKFQ